MPNLQDIKRRRASVRKTQKITRAMKMVAAAKLRRAQDSLLRARPYAVRMRQLTSELAGRAEPGANPLLRRDPVTGGKIVAIVVTGDRGFCGAFNSNVVNEVLRGFPSRFEDRPVELVVVGRRGADTLKRKHNAVADTFTGLMDGDLAEAARKVVAPQATRYANGDIDELVCVYNEFGSAISQYVKVERLLPFDVAEESQAGIDYAYEPNAPSVIDALLTRHMETQMQHILMESAASEYGARMTAMESATNNAAEIIERLTLQYNRARQDAITKELIEVVSGSEAL